MRRDLRFYVISIFSYCVIWVVINIFIGDFPLWINILCMFGSAIGCIIIDGICAGVCHRLLQNLDPSARWFQVKKGERNLWKKFGVRKFKDLLPDLGMLVKFPKGKIVDIGSLEYVHKYLVESCIGEIGHICGAIAVPLSIFILPLKYMLFFGIPAAALNFVFCLMPVIALRYNRYTLAHLHKKLVNKQNIETSPNLSITQ